MRSEQGRGAAAYGKLRARNGGLARVPHPIRFVPREEGPLASWLRAEAAVAAEGSGRGGRGERHAAAEGSGRGGSR